MEGRWGKVETGDGGGAETGEAQRVGANVALEMDNVQARQVAEERDVEADHLGEVGFVDDEFLHLVVR